MDKKTTKKFAIKKRKSPPDENILTREDFLNILKKVTKPLPKPPVQGKTKQEK